MNEVLNLVAQIRNSTGKGSSRALRRNGMAPATIYGNKKTPISISIETKEITKFYRRPQYISQIIEFEIEGKKHKVLPKAIDLHPISELVMHADFVFLNDANPSMPNEGVQKMQVPVVYHNKESCLGVKRGGYFNTIKRLLNIECPVEHLPRKIEIDVTSMPIGHSIKAKDAILPKGAKLLGDKHFVIASIIGRKGKSDDVDDSENNNADSTE